MSQYASNLSYLLRKHALEKAALSAELGVQNPAHPLPDEIVAVAKRFSLTTDLLLKTDLEAREEARSKNIRLVIFDIDGVMTDAGMYYTESGDEFKKFNAKDGLAIRRLKQRGIATGIISHGFLSGVIQRRAERLHISHVEVSQTPKKETLLRWCAELSIDPSEVCFIGDDINDEDIMRTVGFAACPSDAVDAVKEMVHVVLQKNGGEGCIRELIDLYIS